LLSHTTIAILSLGTSYRRTSVGLKIEILNPPEPIKPNVERDMTAPDDNRNKYFADIESASDRHRDRAFDYEKLAIDYSTSTFRTLTYLYGGALIALPAAVALFQVDGKAQKILLIESAGCFIASILLVCVSQAFAFFTMARRSESEWHYEQEARVLVGATHYPTVVEPTKANAEAQAMRDIAVKKIQHSNKYRYGGIYTMWASLVFFLIGCYFGSRAIVFG
jgi:hypothetical protein